MAAPQSSQRSLAALAEPASSPETVTRPASLIAPDARIVNILSTSVNNRFPAINNSETSCAKLPRQSVRLDELLDAERRQLRILWGGAGSRPAILPPVRPALRRAAAALHGCGRADERGRA